MSIRFTLLLLFVLCSVCKGQQIIEIPMTKSNKGNEFRLKASLNGVEYNFNFDSAAPGILISKVVFDDLKRRKKVKDNDITGKTQIELSDGSVVEVNVFRIKQVEVGGVTLQNVKAHVPRKGSGGKMYIGRSAFNSGYRVSVDYQQGVLSLQPRQGAGTAGTNSPVTTRPTTTTPATPAPTTNAPADANNLKIIRLIPCSSADQPLINELKALISKRANLSHVKIEVEANIPPANAVNRITEGSLTVRYFDNADKGIAEAKALYDPLDDLLSQHTNDFKKSAIVRENMVQDMGRSIPQYIEIWIRKQ